MRPRRPPSRHRRESGAGGLENALRGLAVPGPDPGFEHRLRARLLAVGSVQAGAATAPLARRRTPRWLPRAVATAAAGIVGVAGIGVATSRALPGQPLYGAKGQIESWQLAASSGHADRGRDQLSFARTRLAEVEAMSQHQDLTAAGGTDAGGSSADRIASTLRRMDAETRGGTSDLVTAARSGDKQAGRELLTFADDQSARLTAVAPLLPAQAAFAVGISRSVLHQAAALARTLPGASAPGASAPVQGPTSTPEESFSRHAVRPPGSPSPATRAPSTDRTHSSAAPSKLPPDVTTLAPSPDASTLPTSPPSGLPSGVGGLLSGRHPDGS